MYTEAKIPKYYVQLPPRTKELNCKWKGLYSVRGFGFYVGQTRNARGLCHYENYYVI